MSERPILFSTPMVSAILDGRKTQTRRLVKNETGACSECFGSDIQAVPHNEGDGGMGVFGDDPYLRVAYCEHNERGGGRIRCHLGVVGDRLWVRETWAWLTGNGRRTVYRADADPPMGLNGERVSSMKWAPSIHMPRRLSRITLKVTRVRVERLQDISEQDARAEGVDAINVGIESINGEPARGVVFDPRMKFGALWDSINRARRPWDSNPWVWAIDFEREGR